jgi:hypothetical protein
LRVRVDLLADVLRINKLLFRDKLLVFGSSAGNIRRRPRDLDKERTRPPKKRGFTARTHQGHDSSVSPVRGPRNKNPGRTKPGAALWNE